MKIVKGTYTVAEIFTDMVENYALAQIQMLCNHEAFSGSKVRVMPDVHPGKVGTIGFTATVGEKIMPNVVGIDIGCGIALAKLKVKNVEYQKLDVVIRNNIPTGVQIRKVPHYFSEQLALEELCCAGHVDLKKANLSLGTLGGGNHFIELNKDEDGAFYVAIHSGSRSLGKMVTEHYLREGQKYLKTRGIDCPYELTWLEGELMQQYLHDLQIVQEYATLNRMAILQELMKGMKWKAEEIYHAVHNYVDMGSQEYILRKGAVSAKAGEAVVIPVNMRDGILICKGKGNPDWNESAPHGSGRILKREDVKSKFTVSQYKKEIRGVYSSCIHKGTLDEAPFAYRSLADIRDVISDTVTIQKILKPVYNFKAGSED